MARIEDGYCIYLHTMHPLNDFTLVQAPLFSTLAHVTSARAVNKDKAPIAET